MSAVHPQLEPGRAGRREEEAPEERAAPAPAPTVAPTALLALQRSAGNAAVAGMLARDTRRLPAEPTQLSDVAGVAKDMVVDNDELDLGTLSDWFKGPRGADREGVSVTVRFASDMAAKPDPKAEKKLRDGLGGIAVAAFNLQGGTTAPIRTDTVRLRDLDLTPFGGQDGHYRFTSVTRKANAKKAPTEIDVMVERVGARPAELKPWKTLPSARKLELQNRFAKPGYTQAQPTLTSTVDTWTEDQFGMVLQALEEFPEPVLASVPDIVWERGHGKLGPTGEAGFFKYTTRPPERRLIIYDDAFSSDNELRSLIAHELGHAVSAKPAMATPGGKEAAQTPAFKQAVAADGGKAITAYAKTNLDEHFAEAYSLYVTEPDTLRTLRPHVFAYLAGL